jgi:hypothetical protein
MRTPVFDFEITARLHTEETVCIFFSPSIGETLLSGFHDFSACLLGAPPRGLPGVLRTLLIGSLLLHLLRSHLLVPQPLGPHQRPPRQARRRPHQVDGRTEGGRAAGRASPTRTPPVPHATRTARRSYQEPARMDAYALVLAQAVQAHSLCNRFRLVLVLRAPSPTPTSPCPGPSPR